MAEKWFHKILDKLSFSSSKTKQDSSSNEGIKDTNIKTRQGNASAQNTTNNFTIHMKEAEESINLLKAENERLKQRLQKLNKVRKDNKELKAKVNELTSNIREIPMNVFLDTNAVKPFIFENLAHFLAFKDFEIKLTKFNETDPQWVFTLDSSKPDYDRVISLINIISENAKTDQELSTNRFLVLNSKDATFPKP